MTFRFVLILFLALGWLGCATDRATGGDDYPNGVVPVGVKLATSYTDTTDWNGYFNAIPRSGPGLYDTVGVPDTIPGPGDGQDSVTIRVIDSAQGLTEMVRIRSLGSFRQVDTILYVDPDRVGAGAPSGVMVVSRRLDYAPERWDTFWFGDLDKDGFLKPRQNRPAAVQVEHVSHFPGGLQELNYSHVDAGPDLDFNRREDNRLVHLNFERVSGKDTLTVWYQESDSDGVLIDFSRADNPLEMLEIRVHPGPYPDRDSLIREIHWVARADSSRNYPTYFSETLYFKDGSKEATNVFGSDEKGHFLPGQPAEVNLIRWSPEGDSLDTRERRFRVKMADTPGDFDRNALVGMELNEEFVWGRSATDYFSFDFQSAAPIADGGWIGKGGVQSRIQLTNGDWVSFQGQAEASGELRGNAQDNKGKSSAVRFDEDGHLR